MPRKNPKPQAPASALDRVARSLDRLTALVAAIWARDIVAIVKEREKGREAVMKELAAIRKLIAK